MNQHRLPFAAAMLTLLLLAGCAATAPAPSTTAESPLPGPATRPVGRTTTPTPAAAAVDSTPSAEAERVLASIPEPLPPGERVPPPTAADSMSGALDAGEGGANDVPVPAPTRPLGEINPPVLRDSVINPTEMIDHGVVPDTTRRDPPPPPGRPARPDTCWRVQVAAPVERAEADAKRDAAASQLLIPMVIEPEKGLFKVRTRDCLSRESADHLRRRAVDAGFTGAFRIATKRP
jgi:hypothetical protein